ncbi:hypothetical protein BSKO_02801 [Bryopsis sp. KO-2023]|nr:hypothetical protein BSKO_02801 [Bryopsis sp. KO-2023]
MEMPVEKDAMIKYLQASLERAREHEIEAVRARASCEEKLTGKDEKITALEQNIRERDDVINRKEDMIRASAESHEIEQRNVIQEKCSEMKALRTEFDDISMTLRKTYQILDSTFRQL